MLKDNGSAGVLAAGGIAAILASACCLGPLVLEVARRGVPRAGSACDPKKAKT